MKPSAIARWGGVAAGTLGVGAAIWTLTHAMGGILNDGSLCSLDVQQCHTGPIGLVPVSIVGGVVALIIVGACLPAGYGRLLWLAWTALFWSLAFNMIRFGLAWGNQGTRYAFLVPGVLFALMGAVPLFVLPGALKDARRASHEARINRTSTPASASDDRLIV
jgi:hypothetical protein